MKLKAFFKSKSNKNLINFQRKKKLSLKYSNSILFEKRELQLKNQTSKKFIRRKAKVFYTLESNFQTNNHKRSIFTVIPFFTMNPIPSFSTNNTTRNNNLKKTPTYFINKKKIPQLLLTEEALLQNNIITKSKITNTTKTDLESIYQEQKKTKTNNNINFLLTIQKDLKEYRERNKDNNEINEKIEKLNKRDNTRRGMIKKINAFKFLENIILLKKEREVNEREKQENEIEYIQEKINILNKTKKLFNVKFLIGISDYIRYLDSMKNSIRTENINLLKEKMNIKREIIQINNEISKLKEKKESILQWVYFQIKVKEKKLILPNFYKKIIEADKTQLLYMQSQFDENLEQVIIKGERDDKLRAQKLKRSYYKKHSSKKYEHKFSSKFPTRKKANVFSYKSQKTLFRSTHKKTFNLIMNSPSKFEGDKYIKIKLYLGDINSKNKEKEYELLTKDEFDKIVFWKFRPIYKTADEFIENLNYLDLQNTHLLEYYNQLQFKNYCLRHELNQIIYSRDKYDLNIDEKLTKKASELEKIRKKHILILKTHEKINDEKKINKKKKNKDLVNKSFSDSDINKIYNKLNEMFDNCKIVNNQKLTELIYYHIKSEKTKEGEMIYLIEYIECTLDLLLEKISLYKRDVDLSEKIHEISVQIDNKHKLEKPNKQKLENKQKHSNLIEKIKKKSEQQYIIPTRHIDLVHYNIKKLRKPKKKKIVDKDDFPELKDFINNPNIINDNYTSNIFQNHLVQ